MNKLPNPENAVAAIRISSLKQGLQGDSPEDQKEQIELFSQNHNIKIKKFFIFMESASREEQPVQEAIDYCKKPENNIQLFIIKSIDRFTRGGSYLYDHLKMQLVKYGVKLVDIYGVISNQEVNTLEHLNIKYDWSVYNPTKKTEILEAERAKDEMRDIMTRMIGAEIRYVRMGYRVRQPPFGYINEKIETPHGKRVILKPHPEESKWIVSMFELRANSNLNDQEIADKLNNMGYKSRKYFRRDPKDRTKIISQAGENPLTAKGIWKTILKPIYAGINVEKWTNGMPVKGKFKGLVSINMFNKANRGKVIISEDNGQLKLCKKESPNHLLYKSVKNPNFPYKRYIMCPICEKPLYGSASRGKLGKYYPAYHCNNRGHYFRVPKKEFEETIASFISNLGIKPGYVKDLKKYVVDLWQKRVENSKKDNKQIDQKIKDLRSLAKITADKIKYLDSEIAIRYMEKDLVKTEKEINHLQTSKVNNKVKDVNMKRVMGFVGFFLEHLEELILQSSKPLKRAEYFSLLFEKAPTYKELVSGTPKLAPFIRLKEGFDPSSVSKCDPKAYRIKHFSELDSQTSRDI
ncbi:recombinase family protein [Patescibacteria group bacterium]